MICFPPPTHTHTHTHKIFWKPSIITAFPPLLLPHNKKFVSDSAQLLLISHLSSLHNFGCHYIITYKLKKAFPSIFTSLLYFHEFGIKEVASTKLKASPDRATCSTSLQNTNFMIRVTDQMTSGYIYIYKKLKRLPSITTTDSASLKDNKVFPERAI